MPDLPLVNTLDNTTKYTCVTLRYDKTVSWPGSILKPFNIKLIKPNVPVKDYLYVDTMSQQRYHTLALQYIHFKRIHMVIDVRIQWGGLCKRRSREMLGWWQGSWIISKNWGTEKMNSGPPVRMKIHVFGFHIRGGLWSASAVIGVDKIRNRKSEKRGICCTQSLARHVHTSVSVDYK